MGVRNWDFAKWETQKVELGKCVFSTELIFSLIFGTSSPFLCQGILCNKAFSQGCSPAYTYKMVCTVIDYSLRGNYETPVQFQSFSESAIGGPREADYCPVYGSVYSGLKPADLDCRIESNDDDVDVIYGEKYGEDSMCFETSSNEGRC